MSLGVCKLRPNSYTIIFCVVILLRKIIFQTNFFLASMLISGGVTPSPQRDTVEIYRNWLNLSKEKNSPSWKDTWMQKFPQDGSMDFSGSCKGW